MNTITKEEIHVLGFLGEKGGMKAGSFTNALIDAIFKADHEHLGKLHTVYPEYVDAVKSWMYGDLAERAGIV